MQNDQRGRCQNDQKLQSLLDFGSRHWVMIGMQKIAEALRKSIRGRIPPQKTMGNSKARVSDKPSIERNNMDSSLGVQELTASKDVAVQ